MAHAARRSVRRGFVTYESLLWPRPAHCFESADAVGRGSCATSRRARSPTGRRATSTACRARTASCGTTWKVATTTLSPYLSCNFDALPVGGLLRALPAPLPGYLQVGTAREPLKRFVSAVQEVYLRVRIRPNGTRCLHRKVPWIRTAMNGVDGACAAADEPMSDGALAAVFRQMVADVECGRAFPNVHTCTRSRSSSREHVVRTVDLCSARSLGDVQTLKRAVGYNGDERCPLRERRHREAAGRAARMRSARFSPPRPSVQSICNVFIQDFLCLGYPRRRVRGGPGAGGAIARVGAVRPCVLL